MKLHLFDSFKPIKRLRFSIRSRFYILLFLLALVPFLAYRFVVDLHHILLKDQIIIQQQTVINLSYLLENRPDVWSQQIRAGSPTSQLAHLNLDKSAIWVVNEFGQASYVVGRLPKKSTKSDAFFSRLGEWFVYDIAHILPYALPYPFPQSSNPEVALVSLALNGHTYQQYRLDETTQEPISIMSSTPLRLNNRVIGAIILEERVDGIISDSLQYFYRLIGIGSVIFILVLLGALFYTVSLSNRILRLDKDVSQTFDTLGKVHLDQFPDKKKRFYDDELSDLRHHIYQMLNQLGGYERYLKQLPKTLRHEIHNPLNRLSMSLDLLEKEISHKQVTYSQHALAQLKQIINSLSEATSIEDSLVQQVKEPFPIGIMLNHYLDSIVALNPDYCFKIDQKINDNVLLDGDGFMVEQLLDKLISNAKDFTLPNSCIEITAQASAKKITINLKNEGPRLPEGYEQQIFDGMTSIRPTNADSQPHLGLGLYIAKLIVNFHQGEITAQNWQSDAKYNTTNNTPRQGVVFQITLPRAY